MCAKTAPRKAVKVAKPSQRKPSSNSESDDENGSPKRSLPSTSGNRKRSQPKNKLDVSLDFLGRRSSSSDVSLDFLGRRSSPPTNANTSQYTATDSSETSQGRKSRKQPQPKKHRKQHALREIKKYQTTTELLLRKLPFQRYAVAHFFFYLFAIF